MQLRRIVWGLAVCICGLGCQPLKTVGETVQDDAHPPHSWRALTAEEQSAFDLGYAVFNTEWVPANSPAGRIDGLGPLFNSQGCDACHNSRRRGRGPNSDGEAPSDLVVQLGRLLPGRTVARGADEYGYIVNTLAIKGFTAEGKISIRYEERVATLADGTQIKLRAPHYTVDHLSGPELPAHTVLMPRLPPPVQGVGLLERVPRSELVRVADLQREGTNTVRGRISWLATGEGRVIGRFGWQATEPSVASQIANAFSREMGLTTALVSHIDCGNQDVACQNAPTGGSPEVEPGLFDAVVTFQRLHAVPVERLVDDSAAGAHLFRHIGCADCHREALRVETGDSARTVIHPYTDLLLHDMGQGLADRDVEGDAAADEWRTAPLWGMHAAVVSGQPLRLLHDGRARTIAEAVVWHDGEGRAARDRFAQLSAQQRRDLVSWIESL